MAKIMLIDDELAILTMVTELLRGQGHEVSPFSNGSAALEALEVVGPELIVTDLYLGETNAKAVEILHKARGLRTRPVIIVITAFGSIESAVEAMRLGAFDYLKKPFQIEELNLCVRRALDYAVAMSENDYLRNQIQKKYRFNQIIGNSSKMLEVLRMVQRVADSESTTLILGESGTGKELIAKALHYNSRREYAAFVPVNCSALPESLLESELFGHRKGAFTGAIYDKKGLFQEAHGGTILLDEIGSMSPMLQSRLLRVLQEREVRRVGDNTPIYVNVRIVAATNEPLEERVKNGSFREDLYYRLNVISITLPPLRERREDIPLLVSHFLKSKIHGRTGKPFLIARDVFELLCRYPWPGNVRELENAIERACALSEQNILQVPDLPPRLQEFAKQKPGRSGLETPRLEWPSGLVEVGPLREAAATPSEPVPPASSDIVPLKAFLRQQEAVYLRRILAKTGGSKEKAAEMLGVSLATFYRKLGDDPDG